MRLRISSKKRQTRRRSEGSAICPTVRFYCRLGTCEHAPRKWTRAETFHDADVREKMRGIAAGCQKLAQRLEQHASSKGRE